MADVTYYVELPFIARRRYCGWRAYGLLQRAEALSRKKRSRRRGRFSRIGDPATGDFNDAKVIRKFGDVPNDLSAL
jgi:hypothetical protein